MPFGQTLIINLSILGAILLSDRGRQPVSWERLVRPLVICAVVVPIFVHSVPTAGNDFKLQLIGIAIGVLIGVAAVSIAEVDHRTGNLEPATTTGWAYATIWIVASLARIVFAYGSQHWFEHWLAVTSFEHDITSEQAITNGLVFMAVAAALVRVIAIGGRVGFDRHRHGGRRMPLFAHSAKKHLRTKGERAS